MCIYTTCILHQLYLVPDKLYLRIQDHGKRPRDQDVVFQGSSLLSTVARISSASHINTHGLWWSRQKAVSEWCSNATLQACAFWAGTAELSEVQAGLCLDNARRVTDSTAASAVTDAALHPVLPPAASPAPPPCACIWQSFWISFLPVVAAANAKLLAINNVADGTYEAFIQS